ncbi:receptor-type tyrosine-protein phosphatase eta-like [Sinocyclocheilus anshuiensis]|uniref:receptor-type tyrosine-protein phosphatase eta-like n=1 Tax=Sinocyclocheilus anshuiensis TaxID=1608454 RepID=UPI0007BAA329|nr:PREDICTED: receptor-type tyrosine-protein phosphatase eta-like [Sinocyclocheilus anshuiensis]
MIFNVLFYFYIDIYELLFSPHTEPDVIRNLKVTEITTSSVFLTWDEPVGNRSFFKIQWIGDQINGYSATTYTSYNITSLTAGVNYTFCITALTADNLGESEPFCISKYTEPDVIRNLTVIEITTSSVFLTWEEPVGKSSFFKLEWTDEETASRSTTNNTWYNIMGPTAGVNYSFIITAVAADKSTEGESVVISKYMKPDIIMNLTAADVTASSVLLNWTKPNGQSSRYCVEYENNNMTAENTSIEINYLIPGTQYTFRVFAVAADHVTEGRANQISLYTKSDMIRNLKVSEITTSSVFLTWDEPFGNRYVFKIQWTGDQTNATINTFYHITGLTAGVNYTFCITAVTEDDSEGDTLCISQYTIYELLFSPHTEPDVIRNLKVTEITTSSVFLTWEEPVGNRYFFKIQWIGDQINGYSATTNTSYSITSLTAGVNYTFCIPALTADNLGESEPFCISKYTEPDVIRNLIVTEITTSSLFLTWEEPAGNRDFFKLEWTDEETASRSTTNNTWYNIMGPTAGVNYSFIITAVAADKSTEGESVVTSKYRKPDVIMNLTAADITTSSVLLNWTKPNGQCSCYRVEYENNNVTAENTSIKINHLIPGAQYTFRVFAVAADHVTEGRANQISLYTKPDVIRNLIVFEITTSSVLLTWDEPTGNRSFFKMLWTVDKTHATTNTSYLITGLTAGVNYTFCITAVATDNSTEGNNFCISQYTKPDGIRNLGVSEITTSSVVLTWDEPTGNTYFFKLQWADDKTSGNSTTTNTSYLITGLTTGVNYTFSITAVAADESTEGETFCISHYTKPEMVRNLRVTEITTSSLSLTWDEPAGNIDFFRIQWTEKRTHATATNTSYHINDLTAGVNYTFCITAVAADKSTEGETFCISHYTKPEMVRNLRVTEITTSSLSLTWDEPAGNRDFFRIQWTEKRTHATATNTSYHINDLTAGVNYTFCVTAVAADKSTEGETVCISLYTKSPESNTWLIVGVVLAVVCFLFIIILILFFYSRSNTDMRIEDYEEHFKQKHADGFAEEYEKLKTVGMAQSKNAALAIENKEKNRDSNVLPYDASRVKLSICGSPFDDYINASYVPGYKSREEFIAAQCPLPTTVDEFWRMIWEKNVYTIVMLNKCNKQGLVMKCEKYWPSGTNNYHNISVTTTSETELESWIIRDFGIKNVKTEETCKICQFHFTAWPDHGIPAATEVLVDFRCLVRKHMDQYSRHSPAVVHCSSGVATGVFIAIDHLIFQIEKDSMVDVYGIVTDMKMHRPLMVQTEEQYSYLQQCAYDIIRSRTGTNMDFIYQNAAAPQIYENTEYLKQ